MALLGKGDLVANDSILNAGHALAAAGNSDLGTSSLDLEMRRIDKDTGEFAFFVSATGHEVDNAARPNVNIVFSLDVSGSMEGSRIAYLMETVRAVASSLKEGDVVKVKVLEVDKQGRIRLSIKAVEEGEGVTE